MKRSFKEKVIKAMVKVAEYEANAVNTNWPPICLGLLHQPKRPKKK